MKSIDRRIDVIGVFDIEFRWNLLKVKLIIYTVNFFNLHKKLIPSKMLSSMLTALTDKKVDVECLFLFFLCI